MACVIASGWPVPFELVYGDSRFDRVWQVIPVFNRSGEERVRKDVGIRRDWSEVVAEGTRTCSTGELCYIYSLLLVLLSSHLLFYKT